MHRFISSLRGANIFLHLHLRNSESGGNTQQISVFVITLFLSCYSYPVRLCAYFWNAPPDFNVQLRATLHHRAWRRLNVIIRIRRGHEAAMERCVHDAWYHFAHIVFSRIHLCSRTIGGFSKGTSSRHASIKIRGRCTSPPVLCYTSEARRLNRNAYKKYDKLGCPTSFYYGFI